MTLASALCAGMLAGCGSSASTGSTGDSGSTASDDAYNVTVIVKHTDGHFNKVIAGARAYGSEHDNVNVEIQSPTSATSYDEQVNMIETALGNPGIDAVVIAPQQSTSTATLVASANKPVLALDTDFTSDKKACFVGTGNEDAALNGGKAVAEACKALGKDKPTAVIIAGVQGDETHEARLRGYRDAIEAAGGQVLIKNVIPKHLDCISAKLVEMGVYIEDRGDAVLVRRSGPLQKTNVKTMPYPGFPTDMQPQIAAVLSTAQGTSIVNENVWNSRFKYIDELKRMGANIQADGHVAVIEGVEHLQGAPVQACDLRAGAAMVIAGLCAEGVTELSQVQFIERGYEDLVGKLRAVGADIRVVDAPDIAEQKEAHIG